MKNVHYIFTLYLNIIAAGASITNIGCIYQDSMDISTLTIRPRGNLESPFDWFEFACFGSMGENWSIWRKPTQTYMSLLVVRKQSNPSKCPCTAICSILFWNSSLTHSFGLDTRRGCKLGCEPGTQVTTHHSCIPYVSVCAAVCIKTFFLLNLS